MKRKRITGALGLTLGCALLLATPVLGEEFSTLPDLSGYPTRLVVDGLPVAQGEQPEYFDGTVGIPLRNTLEHSGYTVHWDTAERLAQFTDGSDSYAFDPETGALTKNGAVIWTEADTENAAGHIYVSSQLFSHVGGVTVTWDGATNTALAVTAEPSGDVLCYDLGEYPLTNPSRPETPCRMQGVIGVPQGENCPVVIFLHGSHPVERASENRYDLGFSYLVEDLARAGYLALSMNVAINYSFEDGEPIGCERTVQVVQKQVELLAQALAGEQGQFPCDLTGKGDLSRVILVGHSRAGADIFEVATRVPALGVRGLVSVAPAMVSPLSGALPDLPAGIIIPQYDGDVTTLDGATLYDTLENAPGRTADAELLYLMGGNHGGFSTALVRPDPFADRDELGLVMPAASQQEFLRQYIRMFTDSVFSDGRTPYAGRTQLPTELAGCQVRIRARAAGTALYDAVSGPLPQAQGAQAEAVNACSTLENTAGAFRLPGSFLHYDLVRLSWARAGAAASIGVQADLSDAAYLQLDLAQDSADARNGQLDQSMTVTLRDGSGGSASVYVPAGTPALAWQTGEVERIPNFDGSYWEQYSTFTPLISLRLACADFTGVDLSDIRSVVLTFDRAQGSVMLRGIYAA